ETDARHLHAHGQRAAVAIVDRAALGDDAQPALPLFFRELAPRRPIDHHQVVARRDDEPEPQTQEPTQDAHPQADPAALRRAQAIHGKPLAAGTPSDSSPSAAASGERGATGRLPSARMRSAPGASIPSKVRETRSTRSG